MFTSLPGKSLRKAPSVQCAASAAEHTLPKGAEITMYPVKNIDQFKVTNKNAHIVFTKPTETNKKRPFPLRTGFPLCVMSFSFLFLFL